MALLDRLLIDLGSHNKERLMVFSMVIFEGDLKVSAKQRKTGQGFIIPTEDERLRFAETVKKFPNDIFEVESLSEENVRYK